MKIDEREMRWEELSRLVENLGPGWLFRGQQDAEWELKTSLERHTPPERSQSEAEDSLLREFRRRAHLYLQPHHIPDDQGEWLAVMQHFGAPTRLLDITKSPYVALYFAIEDATDPDRDCAVWAFNRTWCIASLGESLFKENPKAREYMQRLIDKGVEIRSKDPAFAVGYYAAGSGGRGVPSKSSGRGVFPYVPERLTERLSIQQGEFLVQADITASFMENVLEAPDTVASPPIKFVMSNRERGRVLEQLRLMNIGSSPI